MSNTKQAEKEYLTRTGSSSWERAKPFSPPGSDTLDDSARMLHDFAVAMLTLRPSPDDLILDLGAGACWCSDLLGRLNRSTIAVDISYDMLAAGRSRPGAAIRAVAGDMEALPFQSNVFNKAVCLSAIHHVPNIGAAVKEISRVLSADGVALFSEPGKGHAEAPVATSAMKDFGVLEQDILIRDFMRACNDAGFKDVRVKPLSYAIPEFDLTLDQWNAWSRLAATKRPRRALAKIGFAFAEFFGLGKQGPLFEDAFGISVVRTLRASVEHHPIVVASKTALENESGRPRWRAQIDLQIAEQATSRNSIPVRLAATNNGSSAWPASSRSGVGHVMLGVQLLDSSGRLANRDYHRIALPHAVSPGQSVTLTFACPTPAEAGEYSLKFDFVAEGVTWFEPTGSVAVTRKLNMTL